jgi:hypothetical protein
VNFLDYTTADYERLLDAALDAGWEFLTIREYLESSSLPEHFVLLRHDVDRRVENARRLARIESERGVDATYYFRTSTFVPEVVEEIESAGHEVGYHYEDLAATGGDYEAARSRFERNLAEFREVSDVRTVCAHGSPLSSQHNPDLWRDRTDELSDLGLLGEAYLSIDVGEGSPVRYLSDTGRSWRTTLGSAGVVETTADLAAAFGAYPCPGLYLLAHPSRWTETRRELAGMIGWDLSAEFAKRAFTTAHASAARLPVPAKSGTSTVGWR